MRITNGTMPDIRPSSRRERSVILLFVGAGGSAAVDPCQYPTTVEFLNRTPNEIKKDPWFIEATRFHSDRNPGKKINIEMVLGALSEMRQFYSVHLKNYSFPGWILKGNGVEKHMTASSISGLTTPAMEEHFARLDSLIRAIHALVFEFYAPVQVGQCAAINNLANWQRLLDSLLAPQRTIEVFTTNYDRLLEQVIRACGLDMEVSTGRVYDGIKTRLDLAYLNPGHLRHKTVEARLTKLHGSVDWQRSSDVPWKDEFVISNPAYTSCDENHVIIYPGCKGRPLGEPFITFHDHLLRVVESADAAIFVGYAFGDKYINEALGRLPFRTPRLVINKEEPLPDLAFLRNATHLDSGFTKHSVRECLRVLEHHGFTVRRLEKEYGVVSGER